MKTIYNIFDELPEPYRSQAVGNVIDQRGAVYLTELRDYSAKEAIARLFQWPSTPEGNEYWKSFHATL